MKVGDAYDSHSRSPGRNRTSSSSPLNPSGGSRQHSPDTNFSIRSSQQATRQPSSRRKGSRARSSTKMREVPEEGRNVKRPNPTSSGGGTPVQSFRAQMINLGSECQIPQVVQEREQLAKYQPSILSGWAEGRPSTPTIIKRPTSMTPPYDPVLGETSSLTNKNVPSPFDQCRRKVNRQKKSIEECSNDIYEAYQDMCTTQRAINLETNSFFSNDVPDLRSSSTISSKSKSQRNSPAHPDDEGSVRHYADGKRRSWRPATPPKSIVSGAVTSLGSSLLGDKLVDDEHPTKYPTVSKESRTSHYNPQESSASNYNPQEDSRELESDSESFEELMGSGSVKVFGCSLARSGPNGSPNNRASLSQMRTQKSAILDLGMGFEGTRRHQEKSRGDLFLEGEVGSQRFEAFKNRMAQYESTIAVMEKRLTREMREKEELRLQVKSGTSVDGSDGRHTPIPSRDTRLVAALHEEIKKLKKQLAAKEGKEKLQQSTGGSLSSSAARSTSPSASRLVSATSRAEVLQGKTKLEKVGHELRVLRKEMEDVPSSSELLAKVISELQLAKRTEENLARQLAQAKGEIASAKAKERQIIRERSNNETLELRARILQLEKETEMVRTQSREELQGRREESYRLKEEVKRLKQELAEASMKASREAKERLTDRKAFESELFAVQKSPMGLQDNLRVTQERLVKAESGSRSSPGGEKDLSSSTYSSLSRSYEDGIAVLRGKLEAFEVEMREERKVASDVDQRRIENIQRLQSRLEAESMQGVSTGDRSLQKVVQDLRSQLHDAQEEVEILRHVTYGASPGREGFATLSGGGSSLVPQLRKGSPSRLSVPSLESIQMPEGVHRSKADGFLNPPFSPQHMANFELPLIARQTKPVSLIGSLIPFIPPKQTMPASSSESTNTESL